MGIEPKLLSRNVSNNNKEDSNVDNNIKKYSFLDDEKNIKLYIDFTNIGEICTDDDILLDYTETSLCLIINNYNNNENEEVCEPKCLKFNKLYSGISNAKYKLKKDKIIIIL